ncbi:hypothetical protein IMCC1989_2168 [gamma proteobacterium IMCC1989]|nr:hypothetical protein IMCC1989_2168 [gamma proteobacterium IMCC1989]
MGIVKRTFSLPEDVSHSLDDTIPNQERSKFIAQTLSEALQKMNRDKLIEAIDNIETWEPSSESVVDTIRKIRESHSARLNDH